MTDLTKPTPAQMAHSDVLDQQLHEAALLNGAKECAVHGWGCWSWGPEHYMCAVKKIRALEDDGK